MTRWLAILCAALLIALLTYVGPADYADALSVDADMKLLRANVAGRSEHITTPAGAADGQASGVDQAISASTRLNDNALASGGTGSFPAGSIFPLLHPLHCGYWIRHCSDWQPCEKPICLEER